MPLSNEILKYELIQAIPNDLTLHITSKIWCKIVKFGVQCHKYRK